MSINGLAIGSDVEETSADTLGGGSFVKPTGLYPVKIDMAYLGESRGGAVSLNLHLKVANDNAEIRQTIYVTSGDAKGKKNYYVGKDGKKRLLPGMLLGDNLSRIATGQALGDLTTEKKTIKLWNFDTSSLQPTEVDALTAMIGKDILIGLTMHRENKRVNDGNGNYVDGPDAKEFNELDKVFFPDGYSLAEKAAEAETPEFHKKWATRFDKDYVKDTFKPVAGGGSTTPKADALPAGTPSGSLFDQPASA